MPNYGLVINSEYNPMSFDEYVKPFLEYAKVYNQMADAYDAMELEAGEWEKLASSAKDAALYALYKKYADDLRAAASDLANNGLSVKTRGSISNLKKRYSNEIKPISEAWDYRNKMIEELRKLNPIGDIQFNIDFTDVGLGEIIQNPTLSYAPGRSLSAIEKAGYEAAVAASARATSKKLKDKGLGNNYYKITQGYTDADIQGFLKELETGEFDKYKELGELYNLIRSSYGTNTDNSIYSSSQNTVADLRLLQGFLKGLTKQESYQAVPRYVGGGGGGGVRSGSGVGTPSDGIRYAAYYTVVNPDNQEEKKKIFIDTYNGKISEDIPTGWKFVNAKGLQVDTAADAVLNNIWATKFGSNFMLYDDNGIPITDKNNLPIMFNNNQRYDFISGTIKHNNNIITPTTYIWNSNTSKWRTFQESDEEYNKKITNAYAVGTTSGLFTSKEQYINLVLSGRTQSLPLILRDPMVFENNYVYVHRDPQTSKTYIRIIPKTEGYNYSVVDGIPTSNNTGNQN